MKTLHALTCDQDYEQHQSAKTFRSRIKSHKELCHGVYRPRRAAWEAFRNKATHKSNENKLECVQGHLEFRYFQMYIAPKVSQMLFSNLGSKSFMSKLNEGISFGRTVLVPRVVFSEIGEFMPRGTWTPLVCRWPQYPAQLLEELRSHWANLQIMSNRNSECQAKAKCADRARFLGGSEPNRTRIFGCYSHGCTGGDISQSSAT